MEKTDFGIIQGRLGLPNYGLLEDWSVFFTLVFMRSKPSAINGTFGRHPYHLGRCLFFSTGTESPSTKTFGGRIGDRNGYLFTAASGLVLLQEHFGHFLYPRCVSLISVSIVFGMAQALILPSCVALLQTKSTIGIPEAGLVFLVR